MHQARCDAAGFLWFAVFLAGDAQLDGPLPNDTWGQGLVVRPEIRYDYADNGIFDAGTENTPFTFGVGAIYAF